MLTLTLMRAALCLVKLNSKPRCCAVSHPYKQPKCCLHSITSMSPCGLRAVWESSANFPRLQAEESLVCAQAMKKGIPFWAMPHAVFPASQACNTKSLGKEGSEAASG